MNGARIKLRNLVFGYQAVGHACLQRLLRITAVGGCVGVVTHRDNAGENRWFASVAKLAREMGLSLYYGEDYTRDRLATLVEDLRPDIIYSFYYRKVLPRRVLNAATVGAFNLHGSLLPKYRGRCPVNWVILNRESQTGVSLHHMVARADAGDIVGQKVIPIGPRETAASLYQRIIPAAADLLEELHPSICEGNAPRIPQDENEASYFGGRRPEDGKIDWTSTAKDVDALIRAVTRPFPGAFTEMGGKRIFIWDALPTTNCFSTEPGTLHFPRDGGSPVIQCGRGSIEIIRASVEGEREISGHELAGEFSPRLRS